MTADLLYSWNPVLQQRNLLKATVDASAALLGLKELKVPPPQRKETLMQSKPHNFVFILIKSNLNQSLGE